MSIWYSHNLDRILLVGSKIWSHFERHPQLGFSSSQIMCLPSNSVWSQKCMRHANAFIKWLFLAPLLAKTSRKQHTKKTCLVSHINQLQSCSTCVAPVNSREREKAPLLCLYQDHFPFSRLPSDCLILPNPRDAFLMPCCHSIKN